MRKAVLNIKARILVPVIANYRAVVSVDEGVSMDKVARAIVKGKIPDTMTVEDLGEVTVNVENAENEGDLQEQVFDYLEDETVKSELLDYEVTDSK